MVIEERQNGNTIAQEVWSAVYVNALVLKDSNTTGNPAQDGLNQRVYALEDANYNVTALMGWPGVPAVWQIVQRYAYDSYGNVQTLDAGWHSTTDAYNWKDLFQGGRFNAATGLYTFEHRDYSPTMMRWVQQDPLGYVNGANRYGFVSENPIRNVDPFGMRGGPATVDLDAGATAADEAAAAAGGAEAGVGTMLTGGAALLGILGNTVGPYLEWKNIQKNLPDKPTPAPTPRPFDVPIIPGAPAGAVTPLDYSWLWPTKSPTPTTRPTPTAPTRKYPGSQPTTQPSTTQPTTPPTGPAASQPAPDEPEQPPVPPKEPEKPKTPKPSIPFPGNPPRDQPPGPDWVWRGQPPAGGGQGNWYNPNTGESLYNDMDSTQHDPHWDYRQKGQDGKWRWYQDGTMEPAP